jgi:hypothetical protein
MSKDSVLDQEYNKLKNNQNVQYGPVIFNEFQERFVLHIEASLFWSKNIGNAEFFFFTPAVPCDFLSSFLAW